jgi:hypothetical protein
MERRKYIAIAQNQKLTNQHIGAPYISFIEKIKEGSYNISGHMQTLILI